MQEKRVLRSMNSMNAINSYVLRHESVTIFHAPFFAPERYCAQAVKNAKVKLFFLRKVYQCVVACEPLQKQSFS